MGGMNTGTDQAGISEADYARARLLTRAVYAQALFLGLTYVIGVWQTITLQTATLTSGAVIAHGIAAGGFTLLTGLVALLAGVQGLRRAAVLNLALFAVSVAGGATGFSFLGNPTDLSGITATNLAMITVVAVGMPVTGFSLASAAGAMSPADMEENRTTRRLTYLALTSLAVTIVTGAGALSALSGMLWSHFAVAGASVLLLAGVFVVTLRKGLSGGSVAPATRRTDYLLLALAATGVAAVTGAFDYLSSGVPYSESMAEFAVLSYGFLFLVAGAGLALPLPRPRLAASGVDPGRRSFLRVAIAGSLVLATVGLASMVRSITLAPPPSNLPPRTFPHYKVANISDVSPNQPVNFNYPLDNEPNILVKLGAAAAGGVGPDGDIVAYSQLCQHLGCVYAFQPAGTSPVCNSSYTATGPIGYCCCHGSIFDLADGAKVVGGPSPRPAPQVILEVDSAGNIFATGMKGPAIFGHSTGSSDVTNDLQGGDLVS